MDTTTEIWDLWIGDVGAQGTSFARARIDATGRVLVHAAPSNLGVDVLGDDGRLLARGRGLERSADTPIARLTRRGDAIEREDVWPSRDDLGGVVILQGGEAGVLKSWWHADDRSEWRWTIELYNHR